MTEFAVKDNEEQKFWRIYEALASQTLIDLEKYFTTAYQSETLGNTLYDLKLMPIYKILEKRLFLSAFAEILEGEKTLGSVEAYLKILYAIFGKQAEITITQQPLHIQIDIVAPINIHYLWKTKSKLTVIAKNGKPIVFKRLLAEVTDRELLAILKSTTKAGTFVEFTLNQEGI